MYRRYLFTSESVTEGHPDKVADRISDAIVDAYLAQDPFSRVAAETIVFTGGAFVTGQITSKAQVNVSEVVRDAVREIGYDASWGYDPDQISVMVAIDRQSPDIAMGVDASLEVKTGEIGDSDYWERLGAGDQGIMFGFATKETPQLMPLPISLAHHLAKRLAEVRKRGVLPFLGPDGKTQVTVLYEDDKPIELKTLVVSVQHRADVTLNELREAVMEQVIKPVLEQYVSKEVVPTTFLNPERVLVNPTGRFVIGGPAADTGLTGRKVIVDTYGGSAHNGGGCFSGKDPTKVDRTASYAARYIAKNIVAAGLADKCEVQLSYVIGVAKPTSIYVNTFGTGKVSEELIERRVEELVDLRPGAIIKRFELYKPIYRPLSAYGHFGREELNLPWEKLDLVDELRGLLKTSVAIS